MSSDAQDNTHHFELDDLLGYLDDIIHSFESHPDESTRQAVFGMLQALDALHRETFRRLIAFLSEREAEGLLADAASRDRVIHTVLGLYDLLPTDEAALESVDAALAPVRPYVESHGGTLNVLRVVNGTVHVEMGGACHGCPGSQITLQRGVRRALAEGYPDFDELVLHESAAQAAPAAGAGGLITVDQIGAAPSYLQAPNFRAVSHLEELGPGSRRQVALDDVQILLANVGGDVYAVGAFCPGTMLPLTGGELVEITLICPWHGERFDIRDGRRLEANGRRQDSPLPVYPVAIQDGEIQVAVNVSARPIIAEVSDG